MRRARFSRREQACLDAVTQLAKVSGDVPKSQGDVAFDVLEEDEAGPDFVDDSGDFGPQMAGIGVAAAQSRLAEGLTGITGRDEMNAAAPRAAVEGSQIVPDSSRRQGLVFHPCHESGRRVSLPLDVTNSPISGLGDVQAEIEAGVAGAERDSAQLGAVSWSVGM